MCGIALIGTGRVEENKLLVVNTDFEHEGGRYADFWGDTDVQLEILTTAR